MYDGLDASIGSILTSNVIWSNSKLIVHYSEMSNDLFFVKGCHGDLTSEERHILLAEFTLCHKKSAISVVNEFAKRKIPSPVAKL